MSSYTRALASEHEAVDRLSQMLHVLTRSILVAVDAPPGPGRTKIMLESYEALDELRSDVLAFAEKDLLARTTIISVGEILQRIDALNALLIKHSNTQRRPGLTRVDDPVDQATRRLARSARWLPASRRSDVLQTERDLLLFEATADDVARRQRFELEDLLVDAVRSRLGFGPSASPRSIAIAVAMIVLLGAAVGLDVSVHFDLAAHFALETTVLPLGVGALLGSGIAWVTGGRRKIS
jgi:hypothetical protein